MKTISIDIETYSSVDLAKSGVYRYAEAPDFEILLFGYSIDGGEVHIVSLAEGKRIPNDIVDALTDDNVQNGSSTQTLSGFACRAIYRIWASALTLSPTIITLPKSSVKHDT